MQAVSLLSVCLWHAKKIYDISIIGSCIVSQHNPLLLLTDANCFFGLLQTMCFPCSGSTLIVSDINCEIVIKTTGIISFYTILSNQMLSKFIFSDVLLLILVFVYIRYEIPYCRNVKNFCFRFRKITLVCQVNFPPAC